MKHRLKYIINYSFLSCDNYSTSKTFRDTTETKTRSYVDCWPHKNIIMFYDIVSDCWQYFLVGTNNFLSAPGFLRITSRLPRINFMPFDSIWTIFAFYFNMIYFDWLCDLRRLPALLYLLTLPNNINLDVPLNLFCLSYYFYVEKYWAEFILL